MNSDDFRGAPDDSASDQQEPQLFEVPLHHARKHKVVRLDRRARGHWESLAGDIAKDEIVVDLFAGGGGATEGIERALGRPVDVAVNHDPLALALHIANHPQTKHYVEDVFAVDPVEAAAGRKVGLCWFSPTCVFFSVAKGGAPLDREEARRVRGLAWVGVKWAKKVRPRILAMENVEPFEDWCRLGPDGRADFRYRGEYFRKFVRALEREGYVVEHRVLSGADYGAPTIRRRLFLIARCDGVAIQWPAPTHGPGRAKPWRTAAECINWDEPTRSIFERKKPLAKNTLKRIAKGIVKYVLLNERPFIVRPGHTAADYPYFRGQSLSDPLGTVTGSPEFALVEPVTAPHISTLNHSGAGARGQKLDEPLKTLTAARDAHALVAPHITRFRTGSVGSPVDVPLNTVTSGQGAKRPAGAAHAMGLVEAHLRGSTLMQTGYGEAEGQAPRALVETEMTKGACLLKYYRDGGQDQSVDKPIHTIPTKERFALLEAPLIVGAGGSARAGEPRPIDAPLNSLTRKDDRRLVQAELLAPALMVNNTNHTGASVEEPLPTLTSGNHHYLTQAAFLTQHNGERGAGIKAGRSVEVPMSTITTTGRQQQVISAFIAQHNEDAIGRKADAPMGTITKSGSQQQVVAAHLSNFYSSNTAGGAGDLEQPMTTVTSGGQHQALVTAQLDAGDLKRARRVVVFLKRYYVAGAKDPAVTFDVKRGVVVANGREFQMVDIRMRMLKPRELYRAQGFPDDYIIDPIVEYWTPAGQRKVGRLPTHEQVAKVGNSVCPPVAEAIVLANFFAATGATHHGSTATCAAA